MRVGIDVGGTHTDAVVLDGKTVIAATKVLTTENVRDGIVNSLDSLLRDSHVDLDTISAVMIGTTQFTNAVVQRSDLAPTAIIRVGLPSGKLIPPMIDWPEDLADALGRHVYMVHGGTTYDGYPLAALSEREIDEAIADIANKQIYQIAVSCVFSPSDPRQEKLVADRILARIPSSGITLSHWIGRLGLLERENAAILNASLLPLANRVMNSFAEALQQRGLRCPFFVSQNDGTLMASSVGAKFPALTFASGPTNSFRGASLLMNLENAVVVDIGGTTSDIGVLQNGFPRQSRVVVDVGGVRTNFRMPDILSIGLGGGSLVTENGNTLGPHSLGHRLVNDGLVFQGNILTATDIAVALGAIGIGDPSRVKQLDRQLVENASKTIHEIIDSGIDHMKGTREPVPVILVGGGAVLISRELGTASRIHRPQYSQVANAIGAANAQVGAELERIVSYRRDSREEHLSSLRSILKERLIASGANPSTIQLADIEETSVSYMADDATRLRVKMVGDLSLSTTR